MNAFRHILGDRLAGAGVLAIVVQLLLIQALVTSFTCTSMAISAGARDGVVICHGGGATTLAGPSSQHRGRSGGVCLDCPCGVCHTPGSAILASSAPNRDLGPAYPSVSRAIASRPATADRPPASRPIDLKPDPTGPPSVLV